MNQFNRESKRKRLKCENARTGKKTVLYCGTSRRRRCSKK